MGNSPLKFKKGYILFSDILWNIQNRNPKVRCTFTVGSRPEGTEDYDSDLDQLIIREGVLICEHIDDVKNSQYDVFVMDRKDCLHGYTKLKRIKRTENTRHDNDISNIVEETITGDYLSNTKVLNSYATYLRETGQGEDLEINGPSITSYLKFCSIPSIDYPQGCEICNIPEEGRQWLQRMGTHEVHRYWPLLKTIRKLQSLKCHVVATGGPDKHEPNHDLQWRKSYTLWERELVWDFTHCQTLCYKLLKKIKKSEFEKITKDINSYHLKNLVFLESVECPRELLYGETESCFTLYKRCLARLRVAIRKRHLTHFIDSKRNLLVGKLENEEERQKLLSLLENVDELVNKTNQPFMDIVTHLFAVKLRYSSFQECLRKEPIHPNQIYGTNVFDIKCAVFEILRLTDYDETVKLFQLFEEMPSVEVEKYHYCSASLKNEVQHSYNKICRSLEELDADHQTLELIKGIITFRFGLFAATYRIHWDRNFKVERNPDTKQITDKYVLSLLNIHTDALSNLLYLCTYFFRDHRVSRAEFEIDVFLKTGPKLLFYCGQCSDFNAISVKSGHASHTEWKNSLLNVPDQGLCYVHDVIVSIDDMNFFPSAVQIQLQIEKSTFFLNPLVYMYYLKACCEVTSNKNADGTIQKLSDTVNKYVNEKNKFIHLNLLGHAYFFTNRYDDAYKCYCTSLLNQKSANSALYLLSILIYKMHKGI